MVKKGDLIGKTYKGKDYMDIFECVCADEEVFVIGKSKFQKVGKDYQVSGVSYENLKAFENTENSLVSNNLVIL